MEQNKLGRNIIGVKSKLYFPIRLCVTYTQVTIRGAPTGCTPPEFMSFCTECVFNIIQDRSSEHFEGGICGIVHPLQYFLGWSFERRGFALLLIQIYADLVLNPLLKDRRNILKRPSYRTKKG